MTSDSAHVLWRTLTTAPPLPSPEPEEKAPLRAIDLAKKIRQEKREEERTTKGIKPTATPLQKRVSELKQFTQQLQNVHPNVLAKHLHKTMLFQNRDVIVLNKPYGVSVKGMSFVTYANK
jgi:23S rRNA-/tRNA-specific pseudouridylate synthase